MKRISSCLKTFLSALWLLQIFIFVIPAQAATRNDFLFNLKDTFNSPVSDKYSISTIIILLVVCALVIWAFRYSSSREENALRSSHKDYQEKVRSQKSSNHQQRNWFRYKTTAEFKWIPAEKASNVKESRYNNDRLLDVSGGGLSFTTAESIKNGDEIKAIIFLDEGKPLPLNAQVVRVTENEGTNSVSTQFIGLRDGQRDRIVAWILKTQRCTNNDKFENN